MRPLAGKVALVTGATRGVGKGIALQLSENGCKVYITGRTLKSTNGSLGSLEETAQEIRKRGGIVIPVQCDHEKPEEVKALFERIEKDEKGQLDILVNNAYKGYNTILSNFKQKFWQSDPNTVWEDTNNVGLKNHYICTVYASRLMVPRRKGLIVNITSLGGQSYFFNVAYGVGKAGLDRMSADTSIELKEHNVVALSLFLGPVKTEVTTKFLSSDAGKSKNMSWVDPESKQDVSIAKVFDEGESTEFAGKVIAKLAQDPKIMSYTGKVVFAADYAQSNGIKDIDGRVIPNPLSLK